MNKTVSTDVYIIVFQKLYNVDGGHKFLVILVPCRLKHLDKITILTQLFQVENKNITFRNIKENGEKHPLSPSK